MRFAQGSSPAGKVAPNAIALAFPRAGPVIRTATP